MDRYHIALFLHLMTLMVAAGATATTKLAAGRRARARTVGEVLEWHNLLESAAKVFPICLVVFVVTGGYMLSIAHGAVWSSGFVVAGLTGSALLFASGGYLGAKGAALKKVLERLASNGADQPAPKLVPPPLVAALPLVNTGIAVSVAFDMVTKPASIPLALGVIAIGIALGAALGFQRPSVSVQATPASQPSA